MLLPFLSELCSAILMFFESVLAPDPLTQKNTMCSMYSSLLPSVGFSSQATYVSLPDCHLIHAGFWVVYQYVEFSSWSITDNSEHL